MERCWLPEHFNIHAFIEAMINQDADKLRGFFELDARIFRSNTNEQFTVDEYIRATCEYPGKWSCRVESLDIIQSHQSYKSKAVFVATFRTTDGKGARAVSFIDFREGDNELIEMLDEYWGDIGDPRNGGRK